MKKKLISIGLMLILCLSMASVSGYAAENAAKPAKVYLVPGSYFTANGETAYHTLTTGAEKLTEAQEAEIYTENVYLATGDAGSALPAPEAGKDSRAFNGWWYTLDAVVTYTETVPQSKTDLFLYADWRAELSQPMDPVNPDGDVEEKLEHYMQVTHKDGSTEQIEMFVSVPDAANVFQRKQYYNEYFVLYPGDEIEFFHSGLYGSKEPVRVPQMVYGKYYIKLEGTAFTQTSHYLKVYDKVTGKEIGGDMTESQIPVFRCVADEAKYYRMFNKFYDSGGSYMIYMEWLQQYTVN